MLKFCILFTVLFSSILAAKTKVACVGDSITYGSGVAAREKLSYPAQLSYLLGDKYEVRNFGVSGATMLNKGDKPYTKLKAYTDSLAFQPDIVIIKLGTNDSKPHNWKHKADFKNDTKALINAYAKLPSKPRIILCKPVVVTKDRWGITENITRGQVSKQVQLASQEIGCELVDLHPVLLDTPQHMPDGVHPNAFGAEKLARYMHQILNIEREINFSLGAIKGEKESFYHGYTCLDFKHKGVACKIAIPKKAAKNRRFIWRARFWGHQPQLDVAMLERGWHIVYCDVSNLYGAPAAVKRWDDFHAFLKSHGITGHCVIEAMSRGGLIAFNWGTKNWGSVSGIIADNAVMDFTSWPGGLGTGPGSAADWERCKKVYGFKNDEEAKKYKDTAISKLEKIRKDPRVLFLVGDADKVVPPSENALKANAAHDYIYKPHLILKQGKGHHPHSLPNPQPMIDFCTGYNPATHPTPAAGFNAGAAGWGKGIWWDQHSNINKVAKKHKDLELIFLGDSITQSWTGSHNRVAVKGGKRPIDVHFASHWKTASFGISGDRTEHLLYRTKNGNFDGLKPKAVVVMIGINNILSAKHNDRQISLGIFELTHSLKKKLPDTQIILLGPFPSGFDPKEERRETIRKIHVSIEKLGKEKNVHYINLTKDFTNKDGSLNKKLYRGDAVHLNQNGYNAWAQALKPHLEKILK